MVAKQAANRKVKIQNICKTINKAERSDHCIVERLATKNTNLIQSVNAKNEGGTSCHPLSGASLLNFESHLNGMILILTEYLIIFFKLFAKLSVSMMKRWS